MPAPENQSQGKRTEKFAEITKVIHYDPEKNNAIFMVKPYDWAKSQIKVYSYMDHQPRVGEAVRVSGNLEQEPWIDQETGQPKLSQSGRELYNYVMKQARTNSPERAKVAGEVERILYQDVEKEYTVALVRPAGWKSGIKVVANALFNEGDFLVAKGFKEKTPVIKDGEQVMGQNGKPIFNTEIKAISLNKMSLKEYSGPITRVFSYDQETGQASILMNPGFKNGKDVKAYINISDEPVEGMNVTISGYTDDVKTVKDGQQYNNLVIRGVSAWVQPQDSERVVETEPEDAAPVEKGEAPVQTEPVDPFYYDEEYEYDDEMEGPIPS